MSFNITTNKLTRREFDIMNILWQSESALVASEIARRGEKLTVNTVQAILRNLLKRNLIEIDQIVYSGTVLTRSYKPTISAEEFEMNHLVDSLSKLSGNPLATTHFIAALLEQEKDSDKLLEEIEQLEELLQEKRQSLKAESSSKEA